MANAKPPKYKIGDTVIWVNSNGVNWGKRKIIGLEIWDNYPDEQRYFIDPIDTPWFSISEEHLTIAND